MVMVAAGGCLKVANFAHAHEATKGVVVECDISHMPHTDMLAPEQLSKGQGGLASDIYALGKIIAFIKYSKVDSEASVNEAAKNKEQLGELLQSMLQKDPSKRPEIDTVRLVVSQTINKRSAVSPSFSSTRETNRSQQESNDKSLTPRKQSTAETAKEISSNNSIKATSNLSVPTTATSIRRSPSR